MLQEKFEKAMQQFFTKEKQKLIEITGRDIFHAVLRAFNVPHRLKYWFLMEQDGSSKIYESIAKGCTEYVLKHRGVQYFDKLIKIEILANSTFEGVNLVIYHYPLDEKPPFVIGYDVSRNIIDLADRYEPSPMEAFAGILSESLANATRRNRNPQIETGETNE